MARFLCIHVPFLIKLANFWQNTIQNHHEQGKEVWNKNLHSTFPYPMHFGYITVTQIQRYVMTHWCASWSEGKKNAFSPQPPKRYVLLPQIQLTFKSARSWRDTPTAFRGALYLPPYINCALMMYLFPTHLHKIQMLYSATFCPFKRRMRPETSKKNSFLSPTEEQRLIVALSLAIANSHKCSSLKRSKQLISRFFFRICEMNRVLIISRFYRHQEDQCSQCSS